jgi:hypothetical protein
VASTETWNKTATGPGYGPVVYLDFMAAAKADI